jgi:hypothetical protein
VELSQLLPLRHGGALYLVFDFKRIIVDDLRLLGLTLLLHTLELSSLLASHFHHFALLLGFLVQFLRHLDQHFPLLHSLGLDVLRLSRQLLSDTHVCQAADSRLDLA